MLPPLPLENLLTKCPQKEGISLQRGFLTIKDQDDTFYLHIHHPKSKSLVFCLHGAGDHLTFPLAPLMADLVAHGYSVFSCDLPGHGPHSKTILNQETLNLFFPKSLEFINSLSPQMPCIPLGMSFGGLLLFKHILKNEGAFATAIFLGVPLKLRLDVKLVWHELSSLWNKDYRKLVKTEGIYSMLPALGPFKRKDFPIRTPPYTKKGAFSYLEAIRAQLGTENAWSPLQKRIKLLFLFGEKDRIAKKSDYIKVDPLIPYADKVVLEGLSHFMLPFAKEAHAQVITFLKKASG